MRTLAFILFLLTTTTLVWADVDDKATSDTNYYCVLCGKGPLTGQMWRSKWGIVCDDCYHKYPIRCSICGIPIDKDYVKTGDGRYICRFDKKDAILDVNEARELFKEVRGDLVELFGSTYLLQYPDVTVSLFDVDYWSEAGRSDGLHKFGFAHSRKTPTGEYTHEVVMLSGRLREEMSATAAHEYTHLWINENRPDSHVIDSDTIEGICELCAYKLMESRSDTNEEQTILANPYTHGEIKKLVALEQDRGMAYILNWVKNGTTANLDSDGETLAAPVRTPVMTFTNVPPPLPGGLKLNGLMLGGRSNQAIVDGVTFSQGDTETIKLRNRMAEVTCEKISQTGVVLRVSGVAGPILLEAGEEKALP